MNRYIQFLSVLVSSQSHKIKSFHLYGSSQETLERFGSHYYDSLTKLQVANYRFPERSSSRTFHFQEVLE